MSVEIHAISTTASCQVSGGEGHLSAETDGRSWGYNGGRSQYFEGDSCYVIVYKSANVSIIGKNCSNGSSWGDAGGVAVGYNLKREGITFSSPIASASKPLPASVVTNGSMFNNCSGPEYLTESTVVRLKTWKATLSPSAAPPYGFVFIEYEPFAIMWAFSNLVKNTDLLNTEVHGVIYGIATPNTGTFVSL